MVLTFLSQTVSNCLIFFLGRCDEVFLQVMAQLQLPIPPYDRVNDPIFSHATPLHPSELRTTSRPLLQESMSMEDASPDLLDGSEKIICDDNFEPSSTPVKSECDDDITYPLDLTMKSCSSNEEEISYKTYSSLNLDLNFPWFTMQYILSNSIFVKQEHNYCRIDDVTAVTKGECLFCWSRYRSSLCLFYVQQLLTQQGVLSDASSDEEEDSGDGPSNSKVNKPVNPGWFGKGYRKTKIRKKRTTT